MADVGTFTYGQARRSQKGGPTIQDGDSYLTDIYTVVIPSGHHPEEYGVTGVPKLGDEWDIASGWTCDQIKWDNTFPSEVWTCDVRYHSDTASWSDEPEPEDQPSGGGKFIHREYQANPWSVDLEFDAIDGRPVINTAGDRFQDALITQRYTTTVIIKSIEMSPPAEKFEKYQGTVNTSATKVAGINISPRAGLLTMQANETDDTTFPWDVTYTIQVAKNPMPSGLLVTTYGNTVDCDPAEEAGFDAVVANVGYRYVEKAGAGTYVLKRFIDYGADGSSAYAIDPHMLDEYGRYVEMSAISVKPYWRRFRRYPEADWGPLNLPDD